jgi:type I restriction enzyme R subunit
LVAGIRERLNPDAAPDISDVMAEITQRLDASITGVAMQQRGLPPLDLSQIDFQALAERFKHSKRKNIDLAPSGPLIRWGAN